MLHKSLFNKTFCILCFSFFSFLSPSELISECAHQTFTFDGRCYNTCPERTFIVPERIPSGSAGSKGLSLRKREANSDEFGNLQDIIGRTESLVKNREIMQGSTQKLCGSCHESCFRCNGPLDGDCVDCDSEYNQIIIGSSVSCRRKLTNATKPTLLDSIKSELKSYSTLKVILISLLMVVSLVITCISIYLLCRRCDSDNGSSDRDKAFLNKYSYDRIDPETEEILLTRLTEAPIKTFVDESDDSD